MLTENDSSKEFMNETTEIGRSLGKLVVQKMERRIVRSNDRNIQRSLQGSLKGS